MKKLKEVKSWFKWDYRARTDEKVLKMFRKEKQEGYGLFVSTIEYLHECDGKIEFDDLSFAIRCEDDDKLNRILNDYGLFYKDGNEYRSQRVDEQLKERKAQSDRAIHANNVRWNK